MKLGPKERQWGEMNSSDLGQEPLVGCCERGIEYSCFITAKNLCRCACQFPNLHSATWNLDS